MTLLTLITSLLQTAMLGVRTSTYEFGEIQLFNPQYWPAGYSNTPITMSSAWNVPSVCKVLASDN
jgi:hypothetical protein